MDANASRRARAALLLMAAGACSSDALPMAQPGSVMETPMGTAPAVEGLVKIESGQVQGDVVDGTRRFLKIPYAKPPVAELRWKSPQKPDPWTGVRHEPELSKACSQNMSSGSETSLNEDCLYLNVWQPMAAPKNAPVMVWIHGGGNFAGGTDDKVPTSQELWFDGKVFAGKQGVVLVTLNYRLGPLGFFAHPDLAAEGSNAGNQGLLDQHQALQWVHDNIAAFGGDPNNVTIFGESAGSADVCTHVASPLDRGLFVRAISESGGCTADLGREMTLTEAEAPIQAFAEVLGCKDRSGQLACLRKAPIDQIMQNAMQPNPMADAGPGQFRFSVVVDGKFLPKRARDIFDAGELNRVQYILGSNSDEGMLFLLGTTGPATDAEYQAELSKRFGELAPMLAAQYPMSAFAGDGHAALARVVGDSGLVCGTHDSARRAAKAGLTVYMYNFNVPWTVGGGSLGATHASEISHVFGLPFMADAKSQTVADNMNAYWARFARSGDPNGADAPAVWPRFQPDADDHDKRLQLDADWKVLDDFRKPECALWRSAYDKAAAD